MQIKEIRDLPSQEIESELEKTREKLFRLRFQAKGKDVENPGAIRNMKRDVARMLTVLSERANSETE